MEKESHKYKWINVFYDPRLATKKARKLTWPWRNMLTWELLFRCRQSFGQNIFVLDCIGVGWINFQYLVKP